MPNTLMLDESYSDMTSQWEKGGKYRVELIITQTSDTGKPFEATVDEVTDYGDAEMPEEEAAPTETAATATPPATNATTKAPTAKAAY